MGKHRMNAMTSTTQNRYPWRTIVRTVFQGAVGLAAMWGIVVATLGLPVTLPWVSTSLIVSAAVTKVMALPEVEAWLQAYFPWLAAKPKAVRPPDYTEPDEEPIEPWSDEEPVI